MIQDSRWTLPEVWDQPGTLETVQTKGRSTGGAPILCPLLSTGGL